MERNVVKSFLSILQRNHAVHLFGKESSLFFCFLFVLKHSSQTFFKNELVSVSLTVSLFLYVTVERLCAVSSFCFGGGTRNAFKRSVQLLTLFQQFISISPAMISHLLPYLILIEWLILPCLSVAKACG